MHTDVPDYRMSRIVDLPYKNGRADSPGAREGGLQRAHRNPSIAYRGLSAEPDIGVLLPCNVVIYAADAAGRTVVSTVDPETSLARVGNDALRPVAA